MNLIFTKIFYVAFSQYEKVHDDEFNIGMVCLHICSLPRLIHDQYQILCEKVTFHLVSLIVIQLEYSTRGARPYSKVLYVRLFKTPFFLLTPHPKAHMVFFFFFFRVSDQKIYYKFVIQRPHILEYLIEMKNLFKK